MGAVSQHLTSLIERQVEKNGIVVWFDPEGHYREFVEKLSLPDTPVETFTGSYFELRRRLEPYLSAQKNTPPRLVVYVPEDQAKTHSALVELTNSGVVMEPGGNVVSRNTRLRVVAKSALQERIGASWNSDLERRIDAGTVSLATLDEMSERRSTILSLIFGTAHPPEVALKLLGSNALDPEVEKQDAVRDLTNSLNRGFGFEPSAGSAPTCEKIREDFARYLLLTDFVASIGEPVPSRLSSVKVAQGSASDACVELAQQWRNREDLRRSYADHADRIEKDMSLSAITVELNLGQLSRCRTFAGAETALQTSVERRVLDSKSGDDEIIPLLKDRLVGFWSKWPERYEDIFPRWKLVEAATELLGSASVVEAGIAGSSGSSPGQILQSYADGSSDEEPWCRLDTHHRRLELSNLNYFRSVNGDHSTLESLVAFARRRYREVGETLSESFLDSLTDSGFDLAGVTRQSETFAGRVAPALKSGSKVAYFLVDSLRYEMAYDFARRLEGRFETELSAALASVPTITEIGMASLMPGAESGLEIEKVSKGKIGLKVAGNVITSRKSRVDHLMESVGSSTSVHEMKLDDIISPSRATAKKVRAADLVLVTSQEIDQQGELGGASARRFMDEILGRIPQAIRSLTDLGCETVVVASDHGYLFADDLDSDTSIDPPGGQTADLHRRAWVGVGGTEEPSFFRFPLSRLGFGGGLDVAVPKGFGAFKSPGGSTAYFHGGMSLQEMAVPVLSVRSSASERVVHTAEIDWSLRLNSGRITTRFVTVLVGGVQKSFLETTPPRVRVEVRVGGKVVSETVSATYDLSESTSDLGLCLEEGKVETNTVTLMVDPDEHPEAGKGEASVHLLDSTTGIELALVEDVDTDISV